MNFYQKHARRPAVPIVSLIDILAILLIYITVTMRIPEKKYLLQISIPKSSALETTPATEARVSLAVNEEGEIYLDGEIVALADLQGALEALKTDRPGAKLEIKADKAISFGDLVGVWDALAKAGFPIKEVPTRLERPGP